MTSSRSGGNGRPPFAGAILRASSKDYCGATTTTTTASGDGRADEEEDGDEAAAREEGDRRVLEHGAVRFVKSKLIELGLLGEWEGPPAVADGAATNGPSEKTRSDMSITYLSVPESVHLRYGLRLVASTVCTFLAVISAGQSVLD